MSEEIKKYIGLQFFHKIKAKLELEEPKFVQNKIINFRENIKNTYGKEPNFVDIMHIINKQARSNNVYPTLIKNGIKSNSKLIRLIYKTTQRLSEQNKPKYNLNQTHNNSFMYKFPKLDFLKKRKEKFESLNIKKIKLVKLNTKKFEEYKTIFRKKFPLKTIDEGTKKSNSIRKLFFRSSTTKNMKHKINFGILRKKNQRNSISFNSKDLSQSLSMTRINTDSLKDSSIIYPSKNRSMNIINKCNNEIEKGNYINKSVTQFKIDLDKLMQGKINPEILLDLDQRVLIEKIKNKYSKLEEKKIANVKKSMKKKISDNLAYERRKEFKDLFKVDDLKAYNIHLAEIQKTNKKLFEKFKIERKKIDKLIYRANIGLRKNLQFMKKIDEINNKNKQLDSIINPNMDLSNENSFIYDENMEKENLYSSFKKG